MKIISFSLWGDNPKYCVGAIRNALLAQEIYPDWVCKFYCGKSVPEKTVDILKSLSNVIVEDMPVDDWTGMFWRFLPASDPAVECMISRDCDSRLTHREKSAVDAWIKSDKGFMIIRDHPWHGAKILGGLWGAKKGVVPDMDKLIQEWKQEDRWQTDQDFLGEIVYDRVKWDSMIFDEFFNIDWPRYSMPLERKNWEFCGQSFDEFDNTIAEHTLAIKQTRYRFPTKEA
jgi:hypothetical protein